MSGCPPVQNSVADYENCAAGSLGLKPYGAIGNGNIQGWINTAATQTKPPGSNSSYAAGCEASLRARGLIYYKNAPGDCGSPTPPGSAIGVPQIVGLGGSAGSGAVAGLGAAGILAGPATLGITAAISVGVGVLESIIGHHGAAVANEQATICAVMNYFNPLIRQIDAAVAGGSISSDEGITYLQQVVNSAKSGLNAIRKVCNAACFYQGFLVPMYSLQGIITLRFLPRKAFSHRPQQIPRME